MNPVARPRTKTVDRYLETMYYIEHEGEVVRPSRLAEWLGVRAPTVTVSLQRLARDGWITIKDDHSVSLTAVGNDAAAHIVRRHRIAERWLCDILGLDWVTADREAGLMSHGLSDLVVEHLDAHLGYPRTCPHGNVIPGRQEQSGRAVALSTVPVGGRVAVKRISEVAEREAPQLLALLGRHGVVPGVVVQVRSSDSHTVSLAVAEAVTSLPAEVAQSVWVTEAGELKG